MSHDASTVSTLAHGAQESESTPRHRPGLLALSDNSNGAPEVLLPLTDAANSDRAAKANPGRKGSCHRWR